MGTGGLILPAYTEGSKDNAYFLFPPDWDGAEIIWRRRIINNVMTSITGKEQRSSLSTVVRHSINYRITTLSPYQAQKLERFLRKYMNSVIGVPVWPYQMVLTEEAAAGSMTIPVDNAFNKELNRLEGIIIGSLERYEKKYISEYSETSLTIGESETPLYYTWPAGTKCYPLLRCFMGTSARNPMIAPHVIQTDGIDFQEAFFWDPDSTYQYPDVTPNTPPYDQYLGYYIWNRFPTWTQPPEQMFDQITNIVGSGFGYQYMQIYQTLPQWGQKAFHSIVGNDNIADFNHFFDTMGGRRGLFWVPSFQPAFELTANIGAGDTNLSVVEHDILDADELSTYNRYIYIKKKGTSYFCRKLTGVTGHTSITIDSSLGEEVAMEDVEMICFLYMVRLDIDELEWRYPAGLTVAETELYYKESLYGYPT